MEALQLLGHIRDWNFNVFLLESLTPYPLVAVAEAAFTELHLSWKLDLNMMKLRRFLVAIQEAYLQQPYHNALHATDVTQTMFHFCVQGNLIESLALSDLSTFALIISACIHDVAHPGVTGKFLVAVGAPLAIQYNDSSPLENMHLATAFSLWMKPRNNFTEKMSKTMYRELRRILIELVLYTDNDRHFSLMEKVESVLSSGDFSFLANNVGGAGAVTASRSSFGRISDLRRSQSDFGMVEPSKPSRFSKSSSVSSNLKSTSQSFSTSRRPISMSVSRSPKSTSSAPAGFSGALDDSSDICPVTSSPTKEPPHIANSLPVEPKQLLLLQLALHSADVSNPVKPWDLHMRWYPRLLEEFYCQGDKERDLGVPITFAFDRLNPVPQPKFQLVIYCSPYNRA